MALVTANLVAEWVAKRATGSGAPSNDPLTTTWADNVGSNDITLYQGSGGFAGTDSSGWDGDGSAGDPYCLVSDGTADYGTFASSWVTSDADFSIELWLYCPSATATNTDLFYGISGDTYQGARGYLSSATDYFTWAIGSGSNYAYASVSSAGHGSWQHHVLTYNAATNSATPYRNGSAGSSASTAFAPFTGTCYLFETGSMLAGCKVATMRVYSACLSVDDVTANYNAGVTAASTDSSATFMPHIMCHHFIPQQLGGH